MAPPLKNYLAAFNDELSEVIENANDMLIKHDSDLKAVSERVERQGLRLKKLEGKSDNVQASITADAWDDLKGRVEELSETVQSHDLDQMEAETLRVDDIVDAIGKICTALDNLGTETSNVTRYL